MCIYVYVFLVGVIGTSPIKIALYFSNAGLGSPSEQAEYFFPTPMPKPPEVQGDPPKHPHTLQKDSIFNFWRQKFKYMPLKFKCVAPKLKYVAPKVKYFTPNSNQ